MCNGLAVIAEKLGKSWQVYAKQGESSHDALLHELREELRYGTAPHIKFEVIFPNQVRGDIVQTVKYPEGWTYIYLGKKIACIDAFLAVFKYIHIHQELLEFTPNMLSKANLRLADLSKAKLNRADLSEADLSEANLSEADLSGANLNGADLRWVDLSEADLNGADLRWTNLSGVNLSEARNVPEKYKQEKLVG